MNVIRSTNEYLVKFPYMIGLQITWVEDFLSESYWVVEVKLSNTRSVIGDTTQIRLVDVRQLKIKSPNIGICSAFQLCDVKERQMEHVRYLFEDTEDGMISCFCRDFEIVGVLGQAGIL